MADKFIIHSPYSPQGDQPAAIKEMAENIRNGISDQILLGATGTGKTFTMAHVIAELNRPALIMSPNKTLAAQLYAEFRSLFPENSVQYFVSYYDYYQPEAYLPRTDTYIEKDSSINDDIDKLRHEATYSLLTRRDVIIVASVSCIYGLGAREYYERMVLGLEVGQKISMDQVLEKLVDIQYERNDYDFHRGAFRVRGDVVELIPAYSREKSLRIEFFGDEIEALRETDPLTGETLSELKQTVIFPGSHYVSDRENLNRASSSIRDELRERLIYLKNENKLLEFQRLEQRTQYDLEMLEECGFCQGIENYSRHLDGREPGVPPFTLLDYFPKDFLLFIDESHISVPQIGGMYGGDLSRKSVLVDYGFRLPSALDNRPLSFKEFLARVGQSVYVSATPGPWELERSSDVIVEQIIRPTGLLDPQVEVRPVKGQVDDLLDECLKRIKKNERVLITTLTKRMAEELTEYLNTMGAPTRYLHSDIETLERVAIIKALRAGEFQVLVGINLLREGLDIPEVSLVAILDADKEGFLRSTRSLIQTFGRAARNVEGQVILYADKITRSMDEAISETNRRREKQAEFNAANSIIPKTVTKEIENILETIYSQSQTEKDIFAKGGSGSWVKLAEEGAAYEARKDKKPKDLDKELRHLERKMRAAAKELEFEEAARLRDKINLLREAKLRWAGNE